MKKSLFTFLVCCILFLTLLHQVNAGPTDPVSIPDAVLRGVIETKLGKSSGDTITEKEMNDMTGSIAHRDPNDSQDDISDLTGLEHATGITILNIRGSNITNLSPLADLTQLTDLNLEENSITDITSLQKLTILDTLDLDNNQIVDITPLKNLTVLTQLNLRFNKITNIEPLKDLTNLTILSLQGNTGISNISHLKRLVSLVTLNLTSTSVTASELSAVLPFFSSLDALSLNYIPLSDLSALNKLPAGTLRSLSLQGMWDRSLPSTQLGLLLKDISPLVKLMNTGKFTTVQTPSVSVAYNYYLDYESFYTHIPALFAGGLTVLYKPRDPQDSTEKDPEPGIERVSEENAVGRPGTRYTFVVQAYNGMHNLFYRFNTEDVNYGPAYHRNTNFKGMPVRWTVTYPDDSTSEPEVVKTGDDGLSRFAVTLGSHGEVYTLNAVVPAKQNTNGPSHDEFSVSFTVTADRDAPPPPPPPPLSDDPTNQPSSENTTSPADTESETPKRRILLRPRECPLGWTRGSVFGNTKKALIYELTVKAEPTNTTSIYQLKSLAIYVHPDENLETLDGWTLKVGTLYNQFGKEFKLTAENSVIDEHDFAHIENPEETPIPMGTLGYIGQSLPSFDYRLYDAAGVRVDFGISCYKGGGLTWRLWNTADPRLLRVLPVTKGEEALSVQMQNLNWDNTPFFRSEWTAAIMPDLPDASFAPSKPKVNVVGTWADLKKQKD